MRPLTRNNVFDGVPEWSPDGSRIVFASAQGGNDRLSVFVMDSDGGSVVDLTKSFISGSNPSWSPDGNWIAFDAIRDTHSENREIYVMEKDGSNFRRLTVNPAWDSGPVSWSKDGYWIYFSSDRDKDDDNDNYEIYRVSFDGSVEENVTKNFTYDFGPDLK